MKRILAFILIAICCFSFVSCAYTGTGEVDLSTAVYAQITMNDGGVIILELYPSVAPITVDNFTKYVKDGFYNGLIFHRVIEGFMIQGGDPTGTGYGLSSLKSIKGEFKKNKVNNKLSHTRGVISMARSKSYNSATSQFFICHGNATHLDEQYAAFGRVIYGMDTVDKIATVPTDMSNRPISTQRIKSIVMIDRETALEFQNSTDNTSIN